MIDLYNNKYDRQVLKDNIYAVKLIDILKTQIIDVTFAVRYILNKNYQFDEEDEKISVQTILHYQPHITKNAIIIEIFKYKPDDDSVDDFETVANRN
jgi:hypothetical protein